MGLDSTYRFYDSSTASGPGSCQNVNGPGNADFTCTEYENGGAVGPVDCGDNGPATYRLFVTSDDAPELWCRLYSQPDCAIDYEISNNPILRDPGTCYESGTQEFASFECVRSAKYASTVLFTAGTDDGTRNESWVDMPQKLVS